MKKYLILLFMIAFSVNTYAARHIYTPTDGELVIVSAKIANMDLDNKVMAGLLKAKREKVDTFLDPTEDRMLIYFSIKYKVAGGQEIMQYGLYDDLSQDWKDKFAEAMHNPMIIKIGYDTVEPLSIQFELGGKYLPTPVLINSQ